MIKINEIKKNFGEYSVLKKISFDIEEGDFLAIIGESGSGKSTLLSILAGFDIPDKGEVIIDGTDIAKLNEVQRTSFRSGKIGFVFQDFMLFDDLTVLENLLISVKYNKKAYTKNEKMKKINEISEYLKIAHLYSKYPKNLSGGEKQRVAIARVMCTEPRYIFADEPTGALDSINTKNVLELFEDVNKNFGVTLIVVTHSNKVVDYAKKVIRIQDGEIVC